MSNENLNRISHTMSDTEMQDLRTALVNIDAMLHFTQGIIPSQNLLGINDQNKAFVEDALNGLLQKPDIFPAYLDAAEIKKDLMLFEQLDSTMLHLNEILGKVKSTRAIAADEAYRSSLTIYRLAESAFKAGIPGAGVIYKSLKERFKQQGNKTNADTNNTPNAEPSIENADTEE